LRAGFCGLLFLATAFGAALALRAALPERLDIPVISAKLAELARRGATVDTLILGTSRAYHQTDPAVFDRRMAVLGHPTHAYNLAADGMNFPESFYVLERALPFVPNLKLVVLEAGPLQHVDNLIFAEGSLRTFYWRDLSRAWLIIRSIWRSPGAADSTAKRLEMILHQVDLMTVNVSNVGRGANLLEQWVGMEPPRSERLAQNGCALDGRRQSVEVAAAFQTRLKTKRPAHELDLRQDPEFAERLEHFVADLRGRGIEPCFAYYPAFRKDRVETPSAGGTVLVANFDDPARYPELFLGEHYYDMDHLNTAGSAIFTNLLAEAVGRHLDGRHP
jgi:hypothetical protein